MKSKKRELRVNRYFSDEFKIQKVKEIEQNLISVTQISKEYSVTRWSIYNWIYKYSNHLKKGINQVVQMESEQEKNKKLQQRIAELERIVGQKQIQIDFLEKMIEIGEKELGVDLKKKLSTQPLTGSDKTKKDTGTK
jgi:transposase